jgi:hypothetical protein
MYYNIDKADFTEHAKIRMKQRSLTYNKVKLLLTFGEEQRTVGQARKIYMSKRSIREANDGLEFDHPLEGSATKMYAVISDTGAIITVGYMRRNRGRRRGR